MKKIISVSFLIIICTLSFCYNINIRVNGVKSSPVFLTKYFGEQKLIVDSTFLDENGQGSFVNDTSVGSGIYMIILDKNKVFEILIGNDEEFSLITDTTDIFFTLEITGAEESQLFLAHQKNVIKKQKLSAMLYNSLRIMEPDDRRRADVENKLNEIRYEIENQNKMFVTNNPGTFASKVVKATIPIDVPEFEAPVNTENRDSVLWMKSLQYFKIHFFDNVDLQDDRLLYTPLIISKLNSFFNQVVFQDPDSIRSAIDYIYKVLLPGKEMGYFIAGFLFTFYNQSDKIGYEDVLVHVMDHYVDDINNVYAEYQVLNDVSFKVNFLKLTALGMIAPDLKLKSLLGGEITIHGINSKYTILLFWNPECPHCEQEIGYLLEFYQKHRFSGIEILAICTNSDEVKWQKSISEKNMIWLNAIDPENTSKFREIYQVYFTPKLYLLDSEKKILAKSHHLVDIVKQLNMEK